MTYPGSKWHRTDEGKQIAGVCAGVAETYGVKADTVRLIYLLALLVELAPESWTGLILGGLGFK
uniref:PspC domain-containing protein n=1 Tax=Corynebacterium sp. TaxID=1720 RepID=UPI0027B8B325